MIYVKHIVELLYLSICRIHTRCLTLLIILYASPNFGYGQRYLEKSTSTYTVTRDLLTVENGLNSHEVFCGIQDNQGFLWFGTRNGLNRYDGRSYQLFNRQKSDLRDNKVVQLAKDGGNHIFIEYGSAGFQLSTNGKIDVLNTITLEVKSLTTQFPHLPFKEEDVYWMSNDGTDEINFLTALPYRLWKYSVKKGFRLFFEATDWSETPNAVPVSVRTTGPLSLFARGKALLKFSNRSTQYFLSGDTVISFSQDDALRSLPIGFTERGELLITYNTSSVTDQFEIGKITRGGISMFPSPDKYPPTDSIRGRYWYQVLCATDGLSSILYIPTDGLYMWSERNFMKILDKSEIKNFENLFLYQLLSDNSGQLWLCTSAGVLQLSLEKNRFRQYFSSKQQDIQTNNQVRGIYADDRGKVFANLWTKLFRKEDALLQTVGDDELKYALIRHSSGLYVGGYNLHRYDELNNKLITIPGGYSSEIWSMFPLNDSIILLGRTDGFTRFNTRNGKFDTISYANGSQPARFVYRFVRDEDENLWAIAENGLFRILYAERDHPEVQQLVPRLNSVTPGPDDESVIQDLNLLDAYFDKRGIVWLATNGSGLYRWDRKLQVVTQFSISNGLPSDVVYRIESDQYNNLWVSTDYGLVKFNMENYEINTYTTNNGISHNEFNRTSSFRANDGRLFFGGLDGVIAFDPRDFISDTSSLNAPLRITSFNKFIGTQSRLVNLTASLLQEKKIILSTGDRFFTLEFRLLDYQKNKSPRYAYKIDGIDKDWNYINENSIRISGLPFGKMTLHVKARNHEGSWSKSEISIPIEVLKPFYRRWWFLAFLVGTMITLIYLIVRYRTKQLADDKTRLANTVAERTSQLTASLAEQAELLNLKDVLIKEVHHRVKNNLQVISGLLELQSRSVESQAARDALREGQTRVKSIALIHQNLYQVNDFGSIELYRFTKDLCRQVQMVYTQGAAVSVNIDMPVFYLDIDTAVPLGLILNELLSNSFKYAFQGSLEGSIDISIKPSREGNYQLICQDNGPGLPPDFDLTRSATLGMQLIYDLSRQIGGNVKYKYNNGARFEIQFTNRIERRNQD